MRSNRAAFGLSKRSIYAARSRSGHRPSCSRMLTIASAEGSARISNGDVAATRICYPYMITLNGDRLTVEQVRAVARGGEAVELSSEACERMRGSRAVIDRIAA